jgi:hypothetical protein
MAGSRHQSTQGLRGPKFQDLRENLERPNLELFPCFLTGRKVRLQIWDEHFFGLTSIPVRLATGGITTQAGPAFP